MPLWLQRVILFVSLICVWLAGSGLTAHAALLKDVRIGEYESYTRLVFEFSEPVQIGNIGDSPAEWLAVPFGKTDTDLKRKIPLDESTSIREIRLFNHQGTLTALLNPGFVRSGYDVFQLDNPPRIVVDLFHGASEPEETSWSETTAAPPPSNGRLSRDFIALEKNTPSVVDVTPQKPETTLLSSQANSQTNWLYRPQKDQLQFYLWLTLIGLALLTVAMTLWLRSARRRAATVPQAPPRDRTFEKEVEPIIELIDRVEHLTVEPEAIIELTERVQIRPKV